jgi:hypothetical protein
LLTRQKLLRSGRLDLVYASSSELLLIELKVEGFRRQHIPQIIGYRDDLRLLQSQANFVRGEICSYILCLKFDEKAAVHAEQMGVHLRAFDPRELLLEFYKMRRLIPDISQLSLPTREYGVSE